MSNGTDPRRRAVLLLGAGFLLTFAVLGALQAFNTSSIHFLNPDSSGETLTFAGLTVVVYLLLLLVLLLLLRNILKLYADQSSNALGSRLRTRMVLGAVLIALTPASFMYGFSYLLMNRSIDRWFSSNITELRDDSAQVVQELVQYVTSNARVEAESIAESSSMAGSADDIDEQLQLHRTTLSGGFAVIYNADGVALTSFQSTSEASTVKEALWLDEGTVKASAPIAFPLNEGLLAIAKRGGEHVIDIDGQEYALGTATAVSKRIAVVGLPMPQGLSQTVRRIRSTTDDYWNLFRSRNNIRTTFFLMLLLITVVVFFVSVWLALFLSKQVTRPVEALADAMDEISDGKYEHRVAIATSGEMAELVRSFNHMAADLDASRQLAESSSAKLKAANQSIEERRRELETIVESIPSGVITLDSSGFVLQGNHAFAALVDQPRDAQLRGRRLEALLPVESVTDVVALMRRGQRMGTASAELEMMVRGRNLHLAATSARLELAEGKQGTVLVLEDTSELLRAQRQVAWKEVAQRVAHEIKNPLTPIALSAERIGRHLDRGQSDSPAIIRKCSEVILSCVGTLRTLVDQFSALAQFPAPQPRVCNVNEVAELALSLFSGRLDGITVQRDLEQGLPPVMADPEGLRRALANLIDNAAEAMQGSLLRVLSLHTRLSEDGSAVEAAVCDTGHGLTEEIRERLFLPFYSTKRRGTGLGLSIAAKIVQEHGGTIRAESNTPKGACFVVRLPLMEHASADSAETEPAAEVRS
jgi:two-component system, NtrC family, nitrogen regulation sensor histidine kinase NtrY